MMDEPKLPAVEHSCAELVAAGARVTFAAVAQHSGIARSILFRTQTLRSVVEDFQRRGRDANTISALSLRAQPGSPACISRTGLPA